MILYYNELFAHCIGSFPLRRTVAICSDKQIDDTIMVKLSDLYYASPKRYNGLVKMTDKVIASDIPIFYFIRGVMHYIECEFDAALNMFKKVIEKEEEDLETIFLVAFCYRHKGEDHIFEEIIMDPRKVRRYL